MELYKLVMDKKFKKRSYLIKASYNFIDANREIYKLLKKEPEQIYQLNDELWISGDERSLIEFKNTHEELYLKNKIINIVENYFRENKIKYIEEESESGSVYITFMFGDNYMNRAKIRISNHPSRKRFADKEFRVDLLNIKNKGIYEIVTNSINNIIKTHNKINFKKLINREYLNQRSY